MNQAKADKLLKRMMNSPAGREIIAKNLPVEFTDQVKSEDRPIVAILVPCYDTPTAEMANALAGMIEECKRQNIVAYTGPVIRDSSVVHWTRNMLLAELIKTQKPWTHVLFIDDDIVPPDDAIPRMLAHGKDIVAGACTRRQDPPIPNFRMWFEDKKEFREVFDWPENRLLEVGAVGTGLMMISRYALEQVANAYFNCLYEIEMYGIDEARQEQLQKARLEFFDKGANAYWFRFLAGLNGANEYGEDISFCLMARRYCKIPVYVDTSIQPGHIGRYAFSIADYQHHKNEVIERAKREGKYIPSILDNEPVPDLKISILCPTRGRPENVGRLLGSIALTVGEFPEVVIYVDEDDEAMLNVQYPLYPEVKTVRGPRRTLSECWNECSKVATGDILMHAGDDIVFKTKGWDTMVKRAFGACEDKILFVHGDDGHFGSKFGTHGFISRQWMDAVGYFVPPYFSSDYNDTWLNDVANALGRRRYLPFVTEHLHPLFGKAKWDQTHKERLERHKTDKVDELYASKAAERAEDVKKLKAVIEAAKEKELATV